MPLSNQPVTRRYQAIVLGFALLIGICLVGGGVALFARFQATNERRAQQQYINRVVLEQTKRNQQGLRLVLCLAQDRVDTSTTLTPAEKANARDFYDDALELIKAEPCD